MDYERQHQYKDKLWNHLIWDNVLSRRYFFIPRSWPLFGEHCLHPLELTQSFPLTRLMEWVNTREGYIENRREEKCLKGRGLNFDQSARV